MTINTRTGNTLLESGVFAPVRAATTAAIALSGLLTIDGVVLIEGDRVLVKDQADQTTNGIYAASSGAWLRTSDALANTDFFSGMAVLCALGVANAGIWFVCTCPDDPVVVGTSLITFAAQSVVLSAMQSTTSATSLPLAVGAMNFAVEAGKALLAKQYVLAYSAANPDNCALCKIVSYAGTALDTTAVSIGGAGTVDDWVIVLANSPASAGRVPPLGGGNVTGPGAAVAGNLPTFADATGKVIADSGILPGTLAGRNSLLFGDAGARSISAAAIADGAAPLASIAAQPSDNLTLSNNLTNPTRDINVSPGRVRDLADVTNLQLVATMVKRLDQAWAPGGTAGVPGGACDSGTKAAGQTWHVYIIGKLGQAITQYSRTSNVATVKVPAHGLGLGGTVRVLGVGAGFDGVAAISAVTTDTISYADGFDILASNQAVNAYPAPAMPSGWTVKQCLGSVVTDGAANLRAFTQIADTFWWSAPLLDSFGNSFTGPANEVLNAAGPYSVPLGVSVIAKANVRNGTSNTFLYLYSPSDTDLNASNGSAPLATVGSSAGGNSECQTEFRTDASAQVRISANTAPVGYAISVLSYRDPRRRLF